MRSLWGDLGHSWVIYSDLGTLRGDLGKFWCDMGTSRVIWGDWGHSGLIWGNLEAFSGGMPWGEWCKFQHFFAVSIYLMCHVFGVGFSTFWVCPFLCCVHLLGVDFSAIWSMKKKA